MDEIVLSTPPQQQPTEELDYIRGALADLEGNILRYLSPKEFAQVERLEQDVVQDYEINGVSTQVIIGREFVGVRFQGVNYPVLVEYEAYSTY